LASGDGSWWDYCVAQAKDKSAVQILEEQLEFEHNRSVAEGLRAEAYAAAARGNETMVSDHDKAAQQREEDLSRRMAEVEAARLKASAEIDAVQERLAKARAGVRLCACVCACVCAFAPANSCAIVADCTPCRELSA
jgi:hypothetical protein